MRIRYSLDLLVYDDTNKRLMLIEVKMRKATKENRIWIKSNLILIYKRFWSDAILLLVTNNGVIISLLKRLMFLIHQKVTMMLT